MPWYGFKLGGEDTEEWVGYTQASTIEEARANLLKRYFAHSIKRIWPDPKYEQRKAHREYWLDVWQQALSNMPRMVKSVRIVDYDLEDQKISRHERIEYGNYTALARCLDMEIKRCKQAIFSRTDRRIITMVGRGYAPRDPVRRAKLLKFAGPYGTFLARIKFTNEGRAHRYKIWPNN